MNNKVTIVDIDIPFGKLIVFIIKWMLASIPAIIIFMIIMAIISAIFGGILTGIFGVMNGFY